MGAAGVRLSSSGGNTRSLRPRENVRNERENVHVRNAHAGILGMDVRRLGMGVRECWE